MRTPLSIRHYRGGLFCATSNPLNAGTWKYTWQNDRQLQKMQKSGETKYTLHGKNIVHMTQGSNELHFFYDAQNKPAVVVYNGTPYSYVKNLQGDIVAILNSAGTAVVNYVYDAWGKPISKSGSMASTLGTVQPFRYRGYVYDEETETYYLRTRLYSADLQRFISADKGIPIRYNSVSSCYAYCHNAPVLYSDADGQCEKAAEMGYVGECTKNEMLGYICLDDVIGEMPPPVLPYELHYMNFPAPAYLVEYRYKFIVVDVNTAAQMQKQLENDIDRYDSLQMNSLIPFILGKLSADTAGYSEVAWDGINKVIEWGQTFGTVAGYHDETSNYVAPGVYFVIVGLYEIEHNGQKASFTYRKVTSSAPNSNLNSTWGVGKTITNNNWEEHFVLGPSIRVEAGSW